MSRLGDYVVSQKDRRVLYYPNSETWAFLDELGNLHRGYDSEGAALQDLAEYLLMLAREA